METALPAWVKTRDGRVIPFDPDVISQDLFNASEILGQPDAFLARELTDGILHFLGTDDAGSMLSTDSIADLVVKVVRELRHPRLAQAFADRPRRPSAPLTSPATTSDQPRLVGCSAKKRFTLQTVFTRDLAAAHEAGLLHLGALHGPQEIAAAVLTPGGPSLYDRLEEAIEARGAIARWAVLDGPERDVWANEPRALCQVYPALLRAVGLQARLHLNCATPPPWAQEAAHGPLFAAPAPSIVSSYAAEALLDELLERKPPHLEMAWHLSARDFEPPRSATLTKLAAAALDGSEVTFAFDRPRRQVQLGPGIDRQHPAILMSVGVDLPRLLEHTAIKDDMELYLAKLASLARLAVSAGVQKRQYLRGQARADGLDPLLARGLLMERARLLVTAVGLDTVVRTLMTAGLCDSKAALEGGCRILQTLQNALTAEGQRRRLQCVLEGADCDGWRAPAQQQLRAAGRLHAVTGAGTAILGLEKRTSVPDLVELLAFAWQQTEVAGVQIRLWQNEPGDAQPMCPT
jgi:hypothetical protein